MWHAALSASVDIHSCMSMLKQSEFFRPLLYSSHYLLLRIVQQDNAQGEIIQLRIKPIQVQRHLSPCLGWSSLCGKDRWIINTQFDSQLHPYSASPAFLPLCHKDEVTVKISWHSWLCLLGLCFLFFFGEFSSEEKPAGTLVPFLLHVFFSPSWQRQCFWVLVLMCW